MSTDDIPVCYTGAANMFVRSFLYTRRSFCFAVCVDNFFLLSTKQMIRNTPENPEAETLPLHFALNTLNGSKPIRPIVNGWFRSRKLVQIISPVTVLCEALAFSFYTPTNYIHDRSCRRGHAHTYPCVRIDI